MKLFELQGQEPIITVEAMLIPEFKALADKGSIGFKELSYVYFSTDFKSIYLSYEVDMRDERLKEDCIGDVDWIPDNTVIAAIKKYEELQQTPTMRFLQANKKAMDSLIQYFENIDWDERTDRGQPVYKVTEVSRAAKEAGAIIDNINKLEDKVKKELAMSDVKARGGSEGGLLEFN